MSKNQHENQEDDFRTSVHKLRAKSLTPQMMESYEWFEFNSAAIRERYQTKAENFAMDLSDLNVRRISSTDSQIEEEEQVSTSGKRELMHRLFPAIHSKSSLQSKRSSKVVPSISNSYVDSHSVRLPFLEASTMTRLLKTRSVPSAKKVFCEDTFFQKSFANGQDNTMDTLSMDSGDCFEALNVSNFDYDPDVSSSCESSMGPENEPNGSIDFIELPVVLFMPRKRDEEVKVSRATRFRRDHPNWPPLSPTDKIGHVFDFQSALWNTHRNANPSLQMQHRTIH